MPPGRDGPLRKASLGSCRPSFVSPPTAGSSPTEGKHCNLLLEKLPPFPQGKQTASQASSRQAAFGPLPRSVGAGGQGLSSLSPLPQGPNFTIPARWGPTLRTAAASNKPARQQTGVREMISQRRLGNKYPRRIEDAQLADCANGRLLVSAQRSEAMLARGS